MNKKTFFPSIFITLFCICSFANNLVELKEHEKWWTVHKEKFLTFTKNQKEVSRVYARQYIKNKGYVTVLDIPCGHCVDYWGFKSENIKIDYYGVDITDYIVDNAIEKGLNVVRGSIENIPFCDSSFDVCYVRHVLEHLDYYEKSISELIRVAKKEALIIFFIKPDKKVDRISYAPLHGTLIHHNKYNRDNIEAYVKGHDKVKSAEWVDINRSEIALHIYIK